MRSPITNTLNVTLVKELATSDIVQCYKKWPCIDVEAYFKNVSKLYLYQCEKTKYLFYSPCIVGDSYFYQNLQDLGWYYQKDRWEYSKALNLIDYSETVLEVGCGQGFFLDKLNSRQFKQPIGLDLNTQAISLAKESGLLAYEETLEQHCLRTQEQYDVICSFQVLEHIPNVKQFLEEMLTLLKPGGKLILAVPNNDSFIKHIDLWANFPPHHVGLWNRRSIASLQDYFPLKLKSIHFEPLQCKWFYQTHLKRFLKTLDHFKESRVKTKLKFLVQSLLVENISLSVLDAIKNYIPGHTLLAAFKKSVVISSNGAGHES